MAGRVGLEFALGFQGSKDAKRARRSSDAFRVLLIGNFSGRTERAGAERVLGAPVRVDAGEFERTLARFEPRLPLPDAAGQDAPYALQSLEELHPDQLFEKLELFAEPRALRRELEAGGSAELLARVRAWLGEPTLAARDGSVPSDQAAEAAASTLERLLGGARAEGPAAPATGQSAAATLIEQAVRPHVVPTPAERGPLLVALDRAIGERLRPILHSVEFRAFESLWRGTERLVRALDTDEELEIWLLDATRADLAASFAKASADLEASRLHALLAADERPWTLVAADLGFDDSETDLTLLGQLGATAGRAGALLLADAEPSLFGASLASAAEPKSWSRSASSPLAEAIRSSPLARQIGLVFPRVLTRRPYGKKRDPIGGFAFEEIANVGAADPAERTYGSGALAVAELLGQRFREQGWDGADQASPLDLEDLPLDTFEDDGERRLTPCAEVALGEAAAAALLERGVMPLVSRRDRASLRLPRLSSWSSPPSPLDLSKA